MLALSALCAPAGCSKHATPAPKGGGMLSPSKVVLSRNVELGKAQQRSLVYRVETVGMLEAEGQTDIAAGVTGVVDEVLFREGDEVRPGTLLATVDQGRYQADEELARTNVERAKANLDLMRDLADRTLRAGNAVSDEDRAKARGGHKIAEAEHVSAIAALARARINLERSRVRAPYAGRINRRLVTKGSYLEERTPIATIADLSRIRLVGYVPETAAPVLRELLSTQETRLDAARLGMFLAAVGADANPLLPALNGQLVSRDYVLSGFDPEFELLAVPGQIFHGRIFYMSTVANIDTHMFEAKAEVLGWTGPVADGAKSAASEEKDGGPASPGAPPPPLLNGNGLPMKNGFPTKRETPPGAPGKRLSSFDPKLWPGFTAKIRFPLRSNPNACVVPEEAVRASERGFIAFVPMQQSREDGQLEWVAKARPLELGFRADGWVEVRQGIQPGEWIVRRGARRSKTARQSGFRVGRNRCRSISLSSEPTRTLVKPPSPYFGFISAAGRTGNPSRPVRPTRR
jgi:RND family efflux transporter MFP subunit